MTTPTQAFRLIATLPGVPPELVRVVPIDALSTTTVTCNALKMGEPASAYVNKYLVRRTAASSADRVRQVTAFDGSTGVLTHAGANYSDTTATSEYVEIWAVEPLQLDQFAQQLAGLRSGIDDAAAGVDDRLPGARHQRHRRLDLLEVTLDLGLVAGARRRLPRHVVPPGELHVFRDVDDHRPRPSRRGDMERLVDRGGQTCVDKECWKARGGSGYGYADKTSTAGGISKIGFNSGTAGKGKADAKGGNNASKGQLSLPVGIVAQLTGNLAPTIEMTTSDGFCVSATMSEVTKGDASRYAARLK